MRRLGLSILTFLIVFGVAGLAVGARQLPHFEQLKAGFAGHDRAILDRNGLFLDEIHRENGTHRFNWVGFSDLPKFLQKALLADDLNLAAHVAGSGSEWRTRLVDWTWKKTELAEAYLNLTVFRHELQGFSAASFGLFDKTPDQLSPIEAAVILALADHDDTVGITESACDWLKRMESESECGLLSHDHLMQIEKSYRVGPFIRMAPQFTAQFGSDPAIVRDNTVHTTLDRELQWALIGSLQKYGLNHAVAAVLENSTGHLLAYVNTEADESDLGARSGAGVLLPFLFAEGVEERVITAGTLLPNAGPSLAEERLARRRRDLVTARAALANRMSIPALSVLQLIGPEHFAATLSSLGLSGFEQSDSFGPSLALGGVDVRLFEVANAYRALANGGVWTPVRVSPDKLSEAGARRVFSPEAAFIIGDILSDHSGHSLVASENWSAGYSDRFSVAIWTSRANAAVPVWNEIMKQLHQSNPAGEVPPPENLVRSAAADAHGRLHGEWFLEGTEPGAQDSGKVASRISYPQDRSTIELEKKENLLIKVVAPRSDQNLYLNGERLGRAKTYLPWEAHNGKFVLELRDSQGHSLDRVRFEVRGRSFALVR